MKRQKKEAPFLMVSHIFIIIIFYAKSNFHCYQLNGTTKVNPRFYQGLNGII